MIENRNNVRTIKAHLLKKGFKAFGEGNPQKVVLGNSKSQTPTDPDDFPKTLAPILR